MGRVFVLQASQPSFDPQLLIWSPVNPRSNSWGLGLWPQKTKECPWAPKPEGSKVEYRCKVYCLICFWGWCSSDHLCCQGSKAVSDAYKIKVLTSVLLIRPWTILLIIAGSMFFCVSSLTHVTQLQEYRDDTTVLGLSHCSKQPPLPGPQKRQSFVPSGDTMPLGGW